MYILYESPNQSWCIIYNDSLLLFNVHLKSFENLITVYVNDRCYTTWDIMLFMLLFAIKYCMGGYWLPGLGWSLSLILSVILDRISI